MGWVLLLAVVVLVGAFLRGLYRAGRATKLLEETEPLVCAHCGEDPDPDGEWFARNVAGLR